MFGEKRIARKLCVQIRIINWLAVLTIYIFLMVTHVCMLCRLGGARHTNTFLTLDNFFLIYNFNL